MLSWAAVTVAGLAGPAAAKPKAPAQPKRAAGRLDLSFGKGGAMPIAFPAEDAGDVGVKYTLPFQFTPGHLEMAPTPAGGVVVAGSTKVAELLPSGQPNKRFGTRGSVAVGRPAGMQFVLADAAVDSRGRVLLAGSARPQPSDSTPDPLISSAVVMRFAANGALDPSFGNEGVLVTDFGIKPPQIGSNRYKGASVGIRGLVVDSENRPVLTGGSVSEVISCYPTEQAVSTGFIARLTENGTLDPAFGDAGLREIDEFSSFEQGTRLPSGSLLTIATGKSSKCESPGGGSSVVLTGFGPEGNLDPDFGFAGFRSVGYSSPPVLAVAPSGKIVLLGPSQSRGKHKKQQLAMRLQPNGGVDQSFGRDGRVRLVMPTGVAFAAVAEDRRGRLLFAGHAAKRRHGHSLGRSTFLLGRMNPTGSFDHSFGGGGFVKLGFGGASSASASQVMLTRKGRVLVGGWVATPHLATGGGFAVARFLNGP